MNIRILVLFAALLLLVAYAASVIGRADIQCIEDRMPQNIPCPTQPSYNCSSGAVKYTSQKQWLIAANNTGVYVASYEGEVRGSKKSFEADVIVETEATCGGSFIAPFVGLFGTARDDRYIVMPGPNVPCFREYNCEWIDDELIEGFMWRPAAGGGQEALWSGVIQQHCRIVSEVTASPMNRETLILATEEDCLGE